MPNPNSINKDTIVNAPAYCSHCGRDLVHKPVRKGYDPETGIEIVGTKVKCPLSWLGDSHTSVEYDENGKKIDYYYGAFF